MSSNFVHKLFARRVLLCALTLCQIVLWVAGSAAQDLGTKQKLIRADGSVQLRYSAYRSERSTFPSNAVYLTASPTIYLYGVAMPLQLTLSNVGVDFRQPFNRFSLKPRYKWAEAQLGWINPHYSEFTMAGYTMLGAGLTLDPGKWEASFSYGRLNRATTLDTLAGQLNPESFDRFGYAMRLSYGSERAKIYGTYLSARDDAQTLQFSETVGRRALLDVEPAANTAASLGFSLPFGKTLSLKAEAAVSVFTENNNIDGTGIDSVVIEAGVPELFTKLIDVNASSDYYPAIRSELAYEGTGPREPLLTLNYRRVAPNYRSMGAFFFQSDIENFLIGAGLRPWKVLRLNGSIGRQRDNLNGIKAATSVRLISSARADLRVKAFATTLDYFNYTNDQTPRISRIGDSLRIASTNQSLSLSPSYTIQLKNTVHLFAGTFSRNSVRDFVGGLSDGAAFRDLNTDLLTATYSLTLLSTSTTLGLTGTYTSLAQAGEDPGKANSYQSQGVNLSLSQAFAKGKGSVSANGGLFGQKNLEASDSRAALYTAGLNASYRPHKRLRFSTTLQYSNGPATGRLAATSSRFSDVRIDTRITYRL